MSLTIKQLAAIPEELKSTDERKRRVLARVAGREDEAAQTRIEELSDYIADIQRDFNDQAEERELALAWRRAAQTRVKELSELIASYDLFLKYCLEDIAAVRAER